MLTMKGYVCHRRHEGVWTGMLLGEPLPCEHGKLYHNLISNGFRLFANRKNAEKAGRRIRDLKQGKIWVYLLELVIAENIKEVETFAEKTSLVVIQKFPEPLKGEHQILGPVPAGISRALPGYPVAENGMLPFTSYKEAYYVGQEVNRQGGCGAALATWKKLRVTVI